MLAGTLSTLLKGLKSLLVHFIKSNILFRTKYDNNSNQYGKFVEPDLKKYHLELEKFDQKCDQLNDFYFHVIQIQQYES